MEIENIKQAILSHPEYKENKYVPFFVNHSKKFICLKVNEYKHVIYLDDPKTGVGYTLFSPKILNIKSLQKTTFKALKKVSD